MWPYWLLFLLPAFMAINQGVKRQLNSKKWPIVWWIIFVILSLAIGLRYEVGGDWFNYLRIFELYNQDYSFTAFITGDPSYKLLTLIATETGGGMILMNAVAALLFTWGLVEFCRVQPRAWLALAVAIPYLVIVVAMGYTRQGVSIGLVMLAIVALNEKKMLRYFLFMAVAVTFHKSAIIMLPLVALTSAGNRWVKAFLLLVIGVLLYWLLVRDATDRLMNSYVTAEYSSAGAAIRLAMNTVPASLFLLLRKRFRLKKAEEGFWTMISISAFVFLVLLQLSPSSTAVDRIALYWIPLQVFVFSRLPDALGRPSSDNTIWVFLILLYYGAVLAVWLFFADNAYGWLPYKFFLWEWFWDLPGKIRPYGW